MMRIVLLTFLCFFDLLAASHARADASAQGAGVSNVSPRHLVVYLDVASSTWRSRGRVSFGIGPALRMKLASAGFEVTQDPGHPHDLILRVDYREERGRPITIDLAGTEIRCTIILDQPSQGPVWTVRIHESPSYAELVSAPYVEVVEKFQTNPYVYFLGDLVRGWTDSRMDRTEALIQALARQIEQRHRSRVTTELDTLPSPAETFPDLDLHFSDSAQENTVEELGRLKDVRALDVLEQLLSHSDRRTRLRAVLAIGEFDAPSVESTMVRVARADVDAEVRDAASAVLAKRVIR
ncbi:MAG TPA: HEAT repeat domain-containing protein [Nitrospira sp.]|nr:HEAT repeat domain-containing protein [Nitrospira sp.]